MHNSSDQFLKTALTALHQRWGSMGDFAWILLGILLISGIGFLVAVLSWTLRGGLSKRFYLR